MRQREALLIETQWLHAQPNLSDRDCSLNKLRQTLALDNCHEGRLAG
jgi:hypothetical protein